jgi:predicted P-loop ATPase/GTPase
LRFLSAIVGKSDSSSVINELTTKATATITLEQVLARLTQHARPGSLVYIISDFRGINDQAETHIAKLSEHCEVVLIFIYDPLESNLPPKGRYRFTDNVRDIVIDTNDQQRLLSYQQRFDQRKQGLELLAKKRGLKFIECSTSEDPLQCLR